MAVQFMTPIFILSDGYIANGSEPWRLPDMEQLERIPVQHPAGRDNGTPFLPYERDENLARPWALPGTPGLMHRIGGLEKEDGTGNVSYDPDNHQHMVETRAAKVAGISRTLDPLDVFGSQHGTLVISWGGTYGSCRTAVMQCQSAGIPVAHVHLRWLNPMPPDLGQVMQRYEQILIPELNSGQLRLLLDATFQQPTLGLNKVKGKPFAVSEIVAKLKDITGHS